MVDKLNIEMKVVKVLSLLFKYLKMESDNLQYFELLCFLKSSLLDFLQTSVGQRESCQVGNIGEDSGIENGNLNIDT